MTSTRVISLLLAACTLSAAEPPTVYHVAQSGHDANPGTSAGLALRTLQAAAGRMKPGDQCLIYAGVYRETLAPAVDGTAGAPLVFLAAPGEAATISPLDPLTGFERVDARTWRASLAWDLGDGNQVFLDGKPLTEARWPNRTGDDPFVIDGARAEYEGSGFDRLRCLAFPEGWTAETVAGATVWCMAQWRWSSWTAPVSGYDPASRTLLLKGHDNWWVQKNHNPGTPAPKGGWTHEPAEFYITGTRALLDAPGEWWFDRAAKMLYLVMEEDQDPNRHLVEAKRRRVAVDLSNRAHVQVRGLQVFGAGMVLTDARNCLVAGVTARFISHSRGGSTTSHCPGTEGILISGSGNVLRDSEIAHSAGSGVVLRGTGNALVNCFIHDTDTFGSYACCVNLGGSGHLVSHNTLRDSGRDCLQYAGSGHLIQYNDISRAGRICHDTGALYQAGCDGELTRICYNWVHDVNTSGGNGIYLDNYTHNYLVHHNVVWDISGNAVQLNHPGHYNMVFHNTVFGGIQSLYSPWQGPQTMFGTLFANNLVCVPPKMKAGSGYTEVANLLQDSLPAGETFDPARLIPPPAAIDRGIALPGINDGFAGAAPDCGAYESGQPAWRAGHDFAHPPSPVYAPPTSFHRNHLRNASFSRAAKGLPEDWRVAEGIASVKRFDGFNSPPADERFSVHNESLCLEGEGDARVDQTLPGLKSGADYVVSAYVRCEGARDVALRVRMPGGGIAEARYSAAEPAVWRLVQTRFRLDQPGAVTVRITKEGPGCAYVDDAGLAPAPPPEHGAAGAYPGTPTKTTTGPLR